MKFSLVPILSQRRKGSEVSGMVTGGGDTEAGPLPDVCCCFPDAAYDSVLCDTLACCHGLLGAEFGFWKFANKSR